MRYIPRKLPRKIKVDQPLAKNGPFMHVLAI